MDGYKYAQGEMVYYVSGSTAFVGRVRYIQKGALLPYWLAVQDGDDIWAKEEELRPYRGR